MADCTMHPRPVREGILGPNALNMFWFLAGLSLLGWQKNCSTGLRTHSWSPWMQTYHYFWNDEGAYLRINVLISCVCNCKGMIMQSQCVPLRLNQIQPHDITQLSCSTEPQHDVSTGFTSVLNLMEYILLCFVDTQKHFVYYTLEQK